MIIYALARHAILLHLVTAANIRGTLNKKNDVNGSAVDDLVFEDAGGPAGETRRLDSEVCRNYAQSVRVCM